MDNVVQLERSLEYLVSRAIRHRMAGRFDEAMPLLTKAKSRFGPNAFVELETARLYEALSCYEEASRAYLRLVQVSEEYRALALFSLSRISLLQADRTRAAEYYRLYRSEVDRSLIDPSEADCIERQLIEDEGIPSAGAGTRASVLERRAAAHLNAGKLIAAKRSIQRSIALGPNTNRYMLLACCELLLGETAGAVEAAMAAYRLKPNNVQVLCLLSDALYVAGNSAKAKDFLLCAASRSSSQIDCLNTAIVSAKFAEDAVTLCMTQKLLKQNPYHIHALTLRACALSNMGSVHASARIFGRLSVLQPENTVFGFLYKQLNGGKPVKTRLLLGDDVPPEEADRRKRRLIELLYALNEGADVCGSLYESCLLCRWALNSPLADAQYKTAAILLLIEMDSPYCQEILCDLLTSSRIADGFKHMTLQLLASKQGFHPYWVELDGSLCRLAAGAPAAIPQSSGGAHQKALQIAASALMKRYPQSAEQVISVHVAYLKRYRIKARHEAEYAAALEYAFRMVMGERVSLSAASRGIGLSPRLCRRYVRRLLPLARQVLRGKGILASEDDEWRK